MAGATKIEWTDATWNPLAGCSVASPGCANCYAAREAAGRLSSNRAYAGLAVRPDDGGPAEFTGEIRTLPDRLDQPLRWQRPRRVFVNSMSDLFHPDVPVGFIGSVWATMGLADRHRFQVLTKRPQRMVSVLAEWAATPGGAYGGPIWRDHRLRWNESPVWPLPNVMLGTSIESDRYTFRADHLRAAPAAARFLSLEPLLGPVPSLNLDGIDWVVVGGESGPGARPMHPDWVRDIRDRCVATGVPFLLKQWGEWAPRSDAAGRRRPTGLSDRVLDRTVGGFVLAEPRSDTDRFGAFTIPGAVGAPWFMDRVGKKAAGRVLDGRYWDETPELWGSSVEVGR